MLYIATVHFQSDRWIDIQLKYLRRHLNTPFRVYACVPEPAGRYEDRFYFASDYEPHVVSDPRFPPMIMSHPTKLNYLADIILKDAEDDDYLVFIDGDAFPIGDLFPFMERTLERFRLGAVRRDENRGDKQPHPSFCATTVGFWREIGGDWFPGFLWKNNTGVDVSDVGGNLLGTLERQKIPWYPMLRSNKVNLHPLWFGIYEGLVYHHGAGFRPPVSRLDLRPYSDDVGKFCESSEYKKNQEVMERVFNDIRRNETFYLEFTGGREEGFMGKLRGNIRQLINQPRKQ
jgi:hypothetical protein